MIVNRTINTALDIKTVFEMHWRTLTATHTSTSASITLAVNTKHIMNIHHDNLSRINCCCFF